KGLSRVDIIRLHAKRQLIVLHFTAAQRHALFPVLAAHHKEVIELGSVPIVLLVIRGIMRHYDTKLSVLPHVFPGDLVVVFAKRARYLDSYPIRGPRV